MTVNFTAGTAVLYRQISVFIHAEYIIELRITECQSIAVQIQRDIGAVDGQGSADANVRRQLDGVEINTSNSRSQLIRGADFCYRLVPAN